MTEETTEVKLGSADEGVADRTVVTAVVVKDTGSAEEIAELAIDEAALPLWTTDDATAALDSTEVTAALPLTTAEDAGAELPEGVAIAAVEVKTEKLDESSGRANTLHCRASACRINALRALILTRSRGRGLRKNQKASL
jgi:hypothetical protein